MTTLSVRGLSKSYGGVDAVSGVDFDLAAGEIVALIGPNGAGKTTCFNMLNGQIAPDAGSIKLFNRELVGLKPRRIWRLGVGRTFQITATFGSMTVIENVQMALISFHRRLRALWPVAGRLYCDDALRLLGLVGMHDQAHRPCSLLAYGDLKRVEFAMALANSPRLLLMDEPTAGMAAGERAELMRLTTDVVRARGISVLFTEHDMDIVFTHADRIMVLSRGRKVADGAPQDVRGNPSVQAVYLGSAPIGDQLGGPA